MASDRALMVFMMARAARQLVDAQAPALRKLRSVGKLRRGAADIDDERADPRRLVLTARGARMNGDNDEHTRGDRDPQQVGRNCTWRRASLSWKRRASDR